MPGSLGSWSNWSMVQTLQVSNFLLSRPKVYGKVLKHGKITWLLDALQAGKAHKPLPNLAFLSLHRPEEALDAGGDPVPGNGSDLPLYHVPPLTSGPGPVPSSLGSVQDSLVNTSGMAHGLICSHSTALCTLHSIYLKWLDVQKLRTQFTLEDSFENLLLSSCYTEHVMHRATWKSTSSRWWQKKTMDL